MMSAMLIAGAVAALAGLGAIALGIPVKEFSFGNTMILSGTIGVCTGLILLGLSAVLGELKVISHRLRLQVAGDPGSKALDLPGESEPRGVTNVTAAPPLDELLVSGGPTRGRGRQAELAPPLPEPEREPPPLGEREQAARPKRNLLFESSLRRDRERGEKRATDPLAAEFRSSPMSEPPAPEPIQPPPFEASWPKPERMRSQEPPPLRRPARAAPAFNEPEPPQRGSETPEVTVVKSGVVDGMAYSLYSDGSIEAQMPEGMMRFNSIAELRTHLDQRG
ncbi:hypothetical protein [Bradyrhizobium sp. STM 3557]|uniref:hypothetical protein n=1 Tax=Bradyrhizobium sp. STM 3557 TaxID=578920 RepID=UPI00388DD07B